MGCDIHLHIEIKIEGNDVWQHYSVPHVSRNYRLFGCMAGVRNKEVEPIASPRGIPSDATVITVFDLEKNWECYAHSSSWLSAKEIREIPQRMGKDFEESDVFGYLFGNDFSSFDRYPEERNGVTDVRFVFWFDN